MIKGIGQQQLKNKKNSKIDALGGTLISGDNSVENSCGDSSSNDGSSESQVTMEKQNHTTITWGENDDGSSRSGTPPRDKKKTMITSQNRGRKITIEVPEERKNESIDPKKGIPGKKTKKKAASKGKKKK